MRDLHLPLPEDTYALLKAEAQRAGVPVTVLARQAIDKWLAAQTRKARHKAIAAFAREYGGTELDLDRQLEAAGSEYLLRTGKAKSAAGRFASAKGDISEEHDKYLAEGFNDR